MLPLPRTGAPPGAWCRYLVGPSGAFSSPRFCHAPVQGRMPVVVCSSCARDSPNLLSVGCRFSLACHDACLVLRIPCSGGPGSEFRHRRTWHPRRASSQKNVYPSRSPWSSQSVPAGLLVRAHIPAIGRTSRPQIRPERVWSPPSAPGQPSRSGYHFRKAINLDPLACISTMTRFASAGVSPHP